MSYTKQVKLIEKDGDYTKLEEDINRFLKVIYYSNVLEIKGLDNDSKVVMVIYRIYNE